MDSTAGTADNSLRRRVDELQTRVELLEAAVLASDAEAEPAPTLKERLLAAEARVDDVSHASATASASREPEPPVAPQTVASAHVRLPPAAIEPKPSERSIDFRDIEERFAGRALALVGGAALLLGAVFFLSLAFSRGWIDPSMQVALGLIGGSVGLVAGAILLFRDERTVGQVLTAVGLAVISLSLFAATSLYELIEPTVALAGVFVAAALTTVIAIRSRSEVVAGFGLAAALAAPPLMGAEPDLVTVAYVGVALVGIAAISLWQTWPWLPPLAFLLSVPQLYQWIETEPELALAMPALLGYWTVMTVAAGGEAFRRARRELSFTSAPLFLAVGAAVIALSFIVLQADQQRAAILLVLAALHGMVTAFFARRRGLLDPFGLLAGAYGCAMATAAVPLLLDAPGTAVVWTAEAVTLAVFARRRHHGPALMGSLALYAIATASLAFAMMHAGSISRFLEIEGATESVESVVVGFAFLLVSGLGMLVTVPLRWYRLLVAGAVSLAALPLAPLVYDHAATVAAWMFTAVIAIGAARGLASLPEPPIRWRLGPALRWLRPTEDLSPAAALVPILAGSIAVLLATAGTVVAVFDQGWLPEVPFIDQAGLSALALAGGLVAIGLVVGGAPALRRCLFAAGLTLGVVSIAEFPAPWYVVAWGALATAAAWMSKIDSQGLVSYRRMAFGALAVLAGLALVEAPPTRLVVGAGGVPPHLLLVSGATLALGCLTVALATVAIIGRERWPASRITSLAALAGASALYLLSIGTVDVFAGEAHDLAYGSWVRIDELAKEAHVALSVLWTAAGVVVLGFGLLLRRVELRVAGLVVLGMATVKVFLFDLSSLDVAYRVITLVFLGLLLVGSAYAWGRMRPMPTSRGVRAGSRGQ